jgi:hypothetical protein
MCRPRDEVKDQVFKHLLQLLENLSTIVDISILFRLVCLGILTNEQRHNLE